MTDEVKKEEVKNVVLGVDVAGPASTEKPVVAVREVKKEEPKPAPTPAPAAKQDKITLTIDGGHYDFDLTPFAKYMAWQPMEQGYFLKEPIYKLLAALSKQLPNGSKVVDLGSFCGGSALAAGTNPNVQVLTVDWEKRIPDSEEITSCLSLPNIKFYKEDCTTKLDKYLDAKIIIVDLHPHDGIQEKVIIDSLVKLKYQGIAILDDIRDFEGLRLYWDTIKLKKYDVSELGHHSGTGVVIFNENAIDVKVLV